MQQLLATSSHFFGESKSEYRITILCDTGKRSPIKILGNAGLSHDLFRCLSWLRGPVAEKSYTHCATSPMPVLAIFFYEILNHSIWESRIIYYPFGRATCPIEDCFQVGQTPPAQTDVKYRPRQSAARRLHAFNRIYCIIVKSNLYVSLDHVPPHNFTENGLCNRNSVCTFYFFFFLFFTN